jgi:nucleotide-binding universal stress UspA family protein
MINNILVPLDGSKLAEAALLVAESLAGSLGASITLLHVIEANAPKQIHGERHLATVAEAEMYLTQMAQQVKSSDIRVKVHVHTEEVRNVARSIVNHCGELCPDLIVMCAHGEGGLRDWMLGSIAQQAIKLGAKPILLLQPNRPDYQPPFSFARYLVALDGHPEHEYGLKVAGELASRTGAAIHLLSVIPNVNNLTGARAAAQKLLPGAGRAMLDYMEDSVNDYLTRHAAIWKNKGVDISVEVCRGNPVEEIFLAAERSGDDLIVLGTHGKAGIDAFWAGSVASPIISLSKIPLLLVPAQLYKEGCSE